MTNTTKKDLLAQVAEQDETAAKAMAKESKAVIAAWLEAAEQDDDENEDGSRKMASTLNRYRAGYTDTVSCSSRLSKNNGDDVAVMLAGAEPLAVIWAAERLLGLESGELATKYAHLNPGQKRMNAGNRIRAAIKRGDATIDDLKKAWAA